MVWICRGFLGSGRALPPALRDSCYFAAMKRLSIKNSETDDLLARITARTGEVKTEAVRHALELYEKKLVGEVDVLAQIDWIRENIHPHVKTEYLGRPPTNAAIEEELELL